ncbi:hypothetical protein Tco_0153226 [Tanacetum coccineum]
MNGWLIEDEDKPLEHEASDKEVDSDLESTASSKPMLKKTTKAIPDRMFRNCPYCPKQIAQPGMNMGQDRQMQLVGGFLESVQNPVFRILKSEWAYCCVRGLLNRIQIGNGNLGLGNLARNYTIRPRRRDAAYLQTQRLNCSKGRSRNQFQAEELDFKLRTRRKKYTELTRTIPEPHKYTNDSNVISEVSSVEQDGGTVDQHPATVEETRAYFESLYNNLAIKVEKVNSVNRKIKETNADLTTELARYKIKKVL